MASIGPGARQLVESRRIGFIQHHCGPAAPGESPHHCVHVTVLGAAAGLQIADLWTLRQQTLNNAQLRAANGASVVAEYVRGVRSPPTPGQSTGSAP